VGDSDEAPPLTDFDRLLAATDSDEDAPAAPRWTTAPRAAPARPSISDGSLLSRALWAEPQAPTTNLASPQDGERPAGESLAVVPANPPADDPYAGDSAPDSELFALLDPPRQPVLTPDLVDATAQAALDDVHEYSLLHPSAAEQPHVFALPPREHTPRRTTSVLDWVALALAVLVAPLGLLVSIVAVIVGKVRNGWASRIAKVGIAVGVVLSLGLAGVGVVLGNDARDAAAEAAIVSSSAEFCSAVDSSQILADDDLAWPAVGDTVSLSLRAMHRYQKTWTALAEAAPTGVTADVTRVKGIVDGLVSSVESTRTIDDERNVTTMRTAASSTVIPAYVAKYCK